MSGLYKELDELERQKLDEQMREDGLLVDDEKDQISDEEKVNGTPHDAPPKQNGNQSTNEVMIID